MARFPRLQVLNAMSEISLVPVFHHADLETAIDVVAATGMGSELITADSIKAGNWKAIEEKTRETLALVREIKQSARK